MTTEQAVGELVQIAFKAFSGRGNAKPIILRPRGYEKPKQISKSNRSRYVRRSDSKTVCRDV